MGWGWLLAIASVGCGRIAFDPIAAADDAMPGGDTGDVVPSMPEPGLHGVYIAGGAPPTLRHLFYEPSARSWSRLADIHAVANDATHLRALSVNGRLYAAVRGSLGTVDVFDVGQTESALSVSVAADAPANTRGFDLAAETASSTLLLVYANATATPQFRVMTAAGWSAEAPIPVSSVGTVSWMKLVPHPTSDEITLLYVTTTKEVNTIVWNGDVWVGGSFVQLATQIRTLSFEDFGGAYEQVSGRFLATWGRSSGAGDNSMQVRPAGSVTYGGLLQWPTGGEAGGDQLVPQPGTDRIAMGTLEVGFQSGNDVTAGTWNGSLVVDGGILATDSTNYEVHPGVNPHALFWRANSAFYVFNGVGVRALATWTPTAVWTIIAATPLGLPVAAVRSQTFPIGGPEVFLETDMTGALAAETYDTSFQASSVPADTAVVGGCPVDLAIVR